MTLMMIITNTPLYVWGIFIYLMILGYIATKTRTIWVPKLFIIPLILTLLKFQKLISVNVLWTIIPWIIGLNLGIIKALLNKKVIYIISNNSIQLPGSYTTLVMFLILFLTRYSLGFLQHFNPEMSMLYSHLDTLITFLFAGYSLGKAGSYTSRFLQKKYRN